MPLDYASIMAAGQNLVPDLRAQMLQDEQARYMADVRKSQAQTNQIALLQKQQAMAREQQFHADLAAATESGKPGAVHQLMIKYPEFADQLKPGWEAQDEATRQRNLTQMGTIYMRAQNGDFAGAASALEARINADKAAGLDTAEDEQILTALKSGDTTQQKVALGAIGMSMAAANPDKFGETYGKLFPSDKQTTAQKEYDWRVQQFGKAAADRWLAVQDEKLVAVNPGGSVYRGSDLVPSAQTGGGDPNPPAGVPAPELRPDGFPAVLTQDQYNATVAAMGKQATDEWMQRNGIQMGGGPVRVRSVQEANALPKGTHYITPDGQEFIR